MSDQASIASKYVPVGVVMDRISRLVKCKNVNIGDIVEWSFEVIKDIGIFEAFEEIQDEEHDVINKQVQLPCDIYRLKHVLPANANTVYDRAPLNYKSNGTYITFYDDPGGSFDLKKVSLWYSRFVTDEHGYPMIYEPAIDACIYKCLEYMYYEDYLTGTLPENRYQSFKSEYRRAYYKAKGNMRYFTKDDGRKMLMAVKNMIKQTNVPRTA